MGGAKNVIRIVSASSSGVLRLARWSSVASKTAMCPPADGVLVSEAPRRILGVNNMVSIRSCLSVIILSNRPVVDVSRLILRCLTTSGR